MYVQHFPLVAWHEQEETTLHWRQCSGRKPSTHDSGGVQRGIWQRGPRFFTNTKLHMDLKPLLFAGDPKPALGSPGLTWMEIVRQAVLVPRTGWVGQNPIIGTPKNQAEVKSLCSGNRELLKVSEKRKNVMKKESRTQADQSDKLWGNVLQGTEEIQV